MPRVVDPNSGRLIVTAQGKRHVLTCGADPISQQAVIHDDTSDMVTHGTSIRIEWGKIDGPQWPFGDLLPCSNYRYPSFQDLILATTIADCRPKLQPWQGDGFNSRHWGASGPLLFTDINPRAHLEQYLAHFAHGLDCLGESLAVFLALPQVDWRVTL